MKKIMAGLIVLIGCMGVIGCQSKSSLIDERDLSVVSKYKEYILASEEGENLNTYAIYRYGEYNHYEKQFTLDTNAQDIETRLLWWNDHRLYFFGNNPKVYNLKTGQVEAEIGLLTLLHSRTGRFDRILGNDQEFIYYQYSHGGKQYVGKVHLNFTTTEEIDPSDVPKQWD